MHMDVDIQFFYVSTINYKQSAFITFSLTADIYDSYHSLTFYKDGALSFTVSIIKH